MKNKPTRTTQIIIIVSLIVVLLFVSVFALRFASPSFRYAFDVVFNCCDSHVSYVLDENGTADEYIIPLPSSSAIAYRLSDTAVVYCTKQNYDSFLKFYQENGYSVNDSTVSDGNKTFSLTQLNEEVSKWYIFIKVELVENAAN